MANPALEEPYALVWARTGLWEPWVVTPGATWPAISQLPRAATEVYFPAARWADFFQTAVDATAARCNHAQLQAVSAWLRHRCIY